MDRNEVGIFWIWDEHVKQHTYFSSTYNINDLRLDWSQ